MEQFKQHRRDFLRAVFAGTAAFAMRRNLLGAQRVGEKPNIVLIMVDDMGYGDLGCYGSTTIKTPHIDALAERGLRFTDFHSNGAVCSPTRAALLTGRYQQRSGIENLEKTNTGRSPDLGFPLAEMTFGELLKNAGYSTALFGKWHLGNGVDFNPAHQGFDEFRGFVGGNIDAHSHANRLGIEDWWKNLDDFSEPGYHTDLITDHGIRFMREHKNEPFCVYIAHGAPHVPLQGPEDPVIRIVGNSTEETVARLRAGKVKIDPLAYDKMVEAVDDGVGRIMEELDRLNLTKKTFVFFCSDNGPLENANAGGLRGWKSTFWEGGHRVCAIAHWPGKIEPGVTAETTMTMDLFPTFAAMADVLLPSGVKIDGVDISPVLFRRESLPERALFWRFGDSKAVRKGPWKLHVNAVDLSEGRGNPKVLEGPHLYNLDRDLAEQNDGAAKHPEKVKELLDALDAWEKDVPPADSL
jgi:arylsulfatase A